MRLVDADGLTKHLQSASERRLAAHGREAAYDESWKRGQVYKAAEDRVKAEIADAFEPRDLTKRADKAWTAIELARITLHECRHTFASYMIAASVNAKALSTYMGHQHHDHAGSLRASVPRRRGRSGRPARRLSDEGDRMTPVARASGPHRGGFPFAKGESASMTPCTTSDRFRAANLHPSCALSPSAERAQ